MSDERTLAGRRIVTAKELGLAGGGGISLVVAGPPGTGKSWFLGSMAEKGPTLLLATMAREAKSVRYQQHNVDVVLLEDEKWRPTAGSFEATAFTSFLNIIEELLDDDHYHNIIIDSGTELGEHAWHEAMKVHGVASPAEMSDNRSRWLPYEQLDILLDQAVKGCVALTSLPPKPKNVAFSWHTQPPKDDTVEQGGTKKSADNRGEGVEYEGNVLPMIRGRFRRRLAGQVDAFLLTELTMKMGAGSKSLKHGLVPTYEIQVRPNPERHTKFPGVLPNVSFIPNEFTELEKLILASLSSQSSTAK